MKILKIKNVKIQNNKLKVCFSCSKEHFNRCHIKTTFNDFDELLTGEIRISYLDNEFEACFPLTERFNQFNDGILKVEFENKNIKTIEYFIIYSLEFWDDYDDELEKIEAYFDDLIEIEESDAEKNILSFSRFDFKIPNNIEELNGYDASWFSFNLIDKNIKYSWIEEFLYVLLEFDYLSMSGNILDEVELYITTKNGAIIKHDDYIEEYGDVPNKIDIWADKKKHKVTCGIIFPIKKTNDATEEGIRLTFVFKDLKYSYIVRKTFIAREGKWQEEELFAMPI